MKSLLLTALALFLALPVFAANGGALISSQTSRASSSSVDQVEPSARGETSLPATETVEPGEEHENNDGVKVENDADSDGDIKMNPKSGNENSATTVDVKNDATGTVSGIDGNDTVNTANGSTTTISGSGGTVNVGSGSSGSITNTNTAGGGGASITVEVGGHTLTVPPGSTVNF